MAEGSTPVSLPELKAYLRIDGDLEDAVLAALLRATVGQVEAWIGAPLIYREVRQAGVAVGGRLRLWHEPVAGVMEVSMIAADGTEVPVAAGSWSVERVAAGPVELSLADGSSGPIAVRYCAGLGVDWNGVPEAIRLAVMRAAAHAFANRDGGEDAGLPGAARQLLAPFRRTRLV
jgi:uncharacterized phiE125 gp8 family phage protein